MSEKPQKTYIAMVLDRSSSMSSLREEAVTWYNEQVKEIQDRAAKDDQEVFTSLVTFNDEIFEHLWAVDAKELKKAEYNDFAPDGMTALWDAVGYTVDKLRETVDVDDEDTTFLILVITDGHENASNHFDAAAIKRLQGSLQETKRWTFTYMGCDESYLHQIARDTGTPISNCAAWSTRSKGHAKRGFKAAVARTSSYLSARADNIPSEVLCCNFHSADDSAPANYTDLPDEIKIGDIKVPDVCPMKIQSIVPDLSVPPGGRPGNRTAKSDSWVSGNGPFSTSSIGDTPHVTYTSIQSEELGGGIFSTSGKSVPQTYWESRKA